MNAEREEAWKPIATCGAVSLCILTPRRVALDRVPMHRDATLVARVVPDDNEAFHLGFINVEAIRGWIERMAPRAVTFSGVSTEDEREMRMMLALASEEEGGALIQLWQKPDDRSPPDWGQAV